MSETMVVVFGILLAVGVIAFAVVQIAKSNGKPDAPIDEPIPAIMWVLVVLFVVLITCWLMFGEWVGPPSRTPWG
jgi:multisubunit Na+/H+ antiporter MnhB subunit